MSTEYEWTVPQQNCNVYWQAVNFPKRSIRVIHTLLLQCIWVKCTSDWSSPAWSFSALPGFIWAQSFTFALSTTALTAPAFKNSTPAIVFSSKNNNSPTQLWNWLQHQCKGLFNLPLSIHPCLFSNHLEGLLQDHQLSWKVESPFRQYFATACDINSWNPERGLSIGLNFLMSWYKPFHLLQSLFKSYSRNEVMFSSKF